MAPTLILALVASLQLLAQIALQLVVLNALGVGRDSDVFMAAQAVPLVLSGILGMALQSVWQPRLSVADRPSGDWKRAHRCAHAQALLAMAGAGSVLAASAPWWLSALYAGFDTETRRLVASLTGPLLLASVLNGASAVLTAAQRGRDRLLSAEVAALILTLMALAVAGPAVRAWGLSAAALLLTCRALLGWIGMLVLVEGSWPDWRAGWRAAAVWKALRPLLAGSAIYKTAPLVDRYWSAMAAAGSVTLLGLAQTGVGAVATVLERALCMPASSPLARALADGDSAKARHLYRRAVAMVALVSVVCGVALAGLQPWWASALGLALDLPAAAADLLWTLCMLMMGYLFVAAAGTVVVAVFYALGDTRTPALIGLGGFLLGIAAKSAGFLAFGLPGLAAATSLYYGLNLLALVWGIERRLARLPDHTAQPTT
jgi:putative peptidoglycan lipid II flippase